MLRFFDKRTDNHDSATSYGDVDASGDTVFSLAAHFPEFVLKVPHIRHSGLLESIFADEGCDPEDAGLEVNREGVEFFFHHAVQEFNCPFHVVNISYSL